VFCIVLPFSSELKNCRYSKLALKQNVPYAYFSQQWQTKADYELRAHGSSAEHRKQIHVSEFFFKQNLDDGNRFW
jgi:hypothetical protein